MHKLNCKKHQEARRALAARPQGIDELDALDRWKRVHRPALEFLSIQELGLCDDPGSGAHTVFKICVHKLYIEPCSSSSFVQLAISHQLREAAEKELTKTSYSSTISEKDTMREAAKAFAAFSELLGEDQWFFGQKQPSMFDASIFAYTHLLLDEDLQWGENELGRQLSQHQNLVAHRDRIIEQFF